MSDNDETSKLETAVNAILAKKELVTFAEYWNLAKELIDGVPVRAYYVRTDVNYVNLAILTDFFVLDLENKNDANPTDIGISLIKSLASVYFRPGPVETIPDSEKSQLTVISVRIGSADVGNYWIAKTGSEREDLIRFGRALLTAVNTS